MNTITGLKTKGRSRRQIIPVLISTISKQARTPHCNTSNTEEDNTVTVITGRQERAAMTIYQLLDHDYSPPLPDTHLKRSLSSREKPGKDFLSQ